VLTKRIGTGVVSTALKRGIAKDGDVQSAIGSMLTLNRRACERMLELNVHGCTDITGFGLIGHAREMAAASGVTIEIESARVQFLPGAVEYARQGALPGGLNNNRDFASCAVEKTGEIASEIESLLYDPQTSGGLLIGLPEKDAVVQAILRFASDWESKPFVTSTALADFLVYLEFYQQAAGVVPMFTVEQMAELERQNPDAVQLMSVHAAKGLEFSHVWLLRVTSSSFPTNYKETLFEFPPALRSSIAAGESKDVHDQEERRLFYVAMTRAMQTLTLSHCLGRKKYGKTSPCHPSPFLSELPAELIERADEKAKQPVPTESGKNYFEAMRQSLG